MNKRHAGPLVLLIAALLCAGCIGGGTFRPVHNFTMENQASIAAGAKPIHLSIQVRRFSVLPRYDRRIARRVSGVQIRFSEYNRWVETPDELVSNAFYRALVRARAFSDVAPPDFPGPADVHLEGRVLTIEATPGGRAALRLALALKDGRSGKLLWQKTIEREEPLAVTSSGPLTKASAAAIAVALSKALDRIVLECVKEWRGVLRSAPRK